MKNILLLALVWTLSPLSGQSPDEKAPGKHPALQALITGAESHQKGEVKPGQEIFQPDDLQSLKEVSSDDDLEEKLSEAIENIKETPPGLSRPKGAKQRSPGQSKASPWDQSTAEPQAPKVRSNPSPNLAHHNRHRFDRTFGAPLWPVLDPRGWL